MTKSKPRTKKSKNQLKVKEITYLHGFVMWPCFKVRIIKHKGKKFVADDTCELVCNPFLQWVFETFFAPFWKGTIYIRVKDKKQEKGVEDAKNGR